MLHRRDQLRTSPPHARGFVLAAWLAVGLLSAGCGYTGDAEIEKEAAASGAPKADGSDPEAAASDTGDPQDDRSKPPARSAYGKAMEAAHRLEDKVEDYNKKLEEAADDAFKPR